MDEEEYDWWEDQPSDDGDECVDTGDVIYYDFG